MRRNTRRSRIVSRATAVVCEQLEFRRLLTTVTFAPTDIKLGGLSPVAIAMGDFNGDGLNDIVTADSSNQSLTVFFGRSNGAFKAAKTFYGYNPNSVAVGDFNGDGRSDIAVANSFIPGTISVLLGNSNGTFTSARSYSVGNSPKAIVIGDFNKDGHPDLAVANYSDANLSILLGNADGSFAPAQSVAAGSEPVSIAVGDFNGDGNQDLVVGSPYQSHVIVLMGCGNGSFGSPSPISVGISSRGVAVGDINKDGNADIVVADNSYSEVFLLAGNGDGTFASSQTLATFSGVKSLALADFNGDGFPDIVASSGSVGFEVLLSNGGGTFTTHYYATGGPVSATVIGDLNHDGKPDIGVTVSSDSSIRIYAGNGSGGFTAPTAPLFTGFLPKAVASADVNKDGKQDIVAITTDSALVLVSNGDSTFKLGSQAIYLPNTPQGIALADVDGDSNVDLVITNSDGSINVFLGNGDGTFNPIPKTTPGGRGYAYSIAAVDVNNDGHPDLIEGSRIGSFVSVLLGNGDGTFQTAMNLAAGYAPSSIAVGDLNGDGKPDIVAASSSNNLVSVFLNSGSGSFVGPMNYPTFYGPERVVIAAFNGHPDIAVAASGQISVLLGNGSGAFQPAQNYTAYGQPAGLAAVDYDGDGKPDLVESTTSTTANFLFGNGDGTFQPSQTVSLNVRASGLFAGDFNGDGKPDLAGAGTYFGDIELLQNDFSPPSPYSPQTNSLKNLTEPTFEENPVAGATQYRFIVATNPADLPINPSATAGGPSVVINSLVGSNTFTPATNLTQGTTYYWESNAVNSTTNGVFSAIQVFTTAATNLTAPGLIAPVTGAANQPTQFTFSWSPVVGATGYEFDLALVSSFLPTAASSGDTTIQKVLGNVTSFQPTMTLSGGTQYFWEVKAINSNANGNFSAISSFTTAPAAVKLGAEQFNIGGLDIKGVAVGDFNGDGHLDFVTANNLSRNLGVVLGTGNGNFSSPTFFNSTYELLNIVAADVNGDGKLDLICSTSYEGIGIFLGNGNGTFQTGKFIQQVSGEGSSVAVRDLNKDGHADIVVSGGSNSAIYVLMGNGDGTFQPFKTIAVGSNGRISAVATADVNGDGNFDLVATSVYYGSPGNLFIVPGNGDGTFGAPKSYAAGNYPRGLTIADFNGDGSPDIAVANTNYQGTVSIFLNNGAGGLNSPITVSAGADPSLLTTEVIGGHRGIVVAGSQSLGFIPGNGDGTFGSFISGRNYYIAAIGVGDFDGDGVPDVVTANGNQNSTTVFLGNSDGSLMSGRIFPIGLEPSRTVTGDFNHDGKPDLAAFANTNSGTIAILLGNGDGTFSLNSFSTVGSCGSADFLTGDFNGDTKPDLLIVDSLGNIFTLLGNGDGTFTPARKSLQLSQTLATNANPVAIGDFNGDGRTDLVVSVSGGTVALLTGCGDGTFANGPMVATVGFNGAALAEGDFNNDGRPDLVIVDVSTQVATVYLNNSNSSALVSSATFAVGDAPRSVAVGDLNGDTFADIVVGNYGDATVNVVRGNGDGTFKAVKTFSAGVYSNLGLALADLNGDGKLDIITTDNYHGTVVGLIGNGNGTFQPATFLGNADVKSIAIAADLKGDGRADVILVGRYSSRITVLLQPLAAPILQTPAISAVAQSTTPNFTWSAVAGATQYLILVSTDPSNLLTGSTVLPSGTSSRTFIIDQNLTTGTSFTPSQALASGGVFYWEVLGTSSSSLGTWSTIRSFTVAAATIQFTPSTLSLGGSDPIGTVTGDFNNDGRLDIASANSGNGTVSILLGNGDGTFKPAQTFAGGPENQRIFAADFNGDGKLDLVTLSSSYSSVASTVNILFGNGNGTFQSPTTVAVGAFARSIAVGDVNGDGLPDIISVDSSSSAHFGVLLNNGNGTFKPIQTFVGACSANSLAIGDVNGDGKADLVAAGGYSGSGAIQIFFGNGSGNFVLAHAYSSVGARSVVLSDLNLDGKLDIAVAKDTSQGGINVFISNGSGTFLPPVTYPTGIYPSTLLTADINGDGNPDLVTVYNPDKFGVLFGKNSHAGFKPIQAFSLRVNYLNTIGVGDFNGDGKVDLIAPNSYTNSINFLPGNGTGNFPTSLSVSIGYQPVGVVASDVNGDGIPDLFVGDARGSVVLFRGNSTGGFQSPTIVSTFGTNLVLIRGGDFNGDGITDLVGLCNNSGQYQVELLLGRGAGAFLSAQVVANTSGSYSNRFLLVADVNGDSKPDLVFPFGPGVVGSSINNGNGTFAPATFVSLASNATVTSVFVADVNGDGRPDLVAGQSDGTLDVLLANVAQAQSYNLGGQIAGVAVGDLNKDGFPDIVASVTNGIDLLKGTGGGHFSAPQLLDAGVYAPASVGIADFNGDGNNDIFVAAGFSYTAGAARKMVSILPGNGNGTFQPPQAIAAVSYSFYSFNSKSSFTDFNGDGIPDIVNLSSQGAEIDFLANKTNLPSLSSPTLLLPGNNSTNQSTTPNFTWAKVAGATGYRIFVASNAADLPTNPTSLVGGASVVINSAVTANSFMSNVTLSTGTQYFWEVVATAGAREGNFSSVSNFTTGSPTITTTNNATTVQGTGGADSVSVTVSNGMVMITIDGQPSQMTSMSGTVDVKLGGGDDTVTIGSGLPPVSVNGGSGNDMLTSTGTTSVTLAGGAGNDTIGSSSSMSMLKGGGGDDFILTGGGTGDTVNGGAGLNFAQYNPTDAVTKVFEVFDAPAPPVSIPASAPALAPSALAPADASTTAVVTAGILVVGGTAGADSITVTLDGANVDVTANGSSAGSFPLANLIGISMGGGPGSDTLVVDSLVPLPATIVGGKSRDSLVGGDFDNVIMGGQGPDTLVGGAGTNLLIPGTQGYGNVTNGNDSLVGGSGYSIADFSHRTDGLKLSNDGIADSGDPLLGEKIIIGTDISAIWGGTSADTIVATTAGEFISGGFGPDKITSEGQSNVIVGGLGKDTIVVGAEPVALYLNDDKRDIYSGVSNPLEDILEFDHKDRVLS